MFSGTAKSKRFFLFDCYFNCVSLASGYSLGRAKSFLIPLLQFEVKVWFMLVGIVQ